MTPEDVKPQTTCEVDVRFPDGHVESRIVPVEPFFLVKDAIRMALAYGDSLSRADISSVQWREKFKELGK